MKLRDPDAVVLSRIYSFAGHVCRLEAYDPQRLTLQVFRDRDRMWAREQVVSVGHGGHPGRFSPWNYEFMFDRYWAPRGVEWTTVASDKDRWKSKEINWIKFMLGSQSELSFV